jgi:hypothetical protein
MGRERGARRSVRCGLHGRFYDAWSVAGCPDCAKRSPLLRARGGRGWSAALLLLAGAAGLAHWQGRLPVLTNTIRIEPAPALATAQRPPAPRGDRLDVQALERFEATLSTLLADGRRELPAIGEPSLAAAEGSSAEAHLAPDRAELSRGWEQRVSLACAEAPAAPALGAGLHVVTAHQLLEDACHQLRLAIASPGEAPLPTKPWGQGPLDQAAARIAEARAQLDAAMR